MTTPQAGPRFSRLGTRLLLPLLSIVTIIMIAYAFRALAEREEALAPQARLEVQAYATALGLAFDLAVRNVQREHVQTLINEVTRSPTVYAILIYDSTGVPVYVSDPLPAVSGASADLLREVLVRGGTATVERELEEQRVFSVLRALRSPDGRVNGVLEVAQPQSSIEAEKAKIRGRFFFNTVTLLVMLTLVTLWLVRRVVARPMERLSAAVRAFGRGELDHRIEENPRDGELGELAREFNRMAGNLETAREAIAREAEERVALERRLREAEKLAAIGNLAAGLAHEIAAPLNVISGRAEILLGKDVEPPAQHRNLGIIMHQINRITTIVRNLLDFAKRREPRLSPLDLCRAVDDALEFLEVELTTARVQVIRDAACPVWIPGDADLIHQVLTNLILNAIQAMEALEGVRRLTVRLRQASPEHTVLDIEDSGPGISAEVLPTIFEPFVTTKPRGTGMGLVVARRIVEEHGGRIEARSDGGGTVIRAILPSSEPPPGAEGRPPG